ncbi:MAG: formylglycine-generating enzyme family protein [Planctomycetaceae bacterium]
MKDDIKRIQDYVWARYIEGSDHYDTTVQDDEAIRVLDGHYSEVGNRNSSDQFYLGILLFERAFERPEVQRELFERCRKIFEFYRRVTGEFDWTVIEDRLADIHEHLRDEEPAPPVATKDEPLAPAAGPAAAVEAATPAAEAPPVVSAPQATHVAEPAPAPPVESAAEEEARRREHERRQRRDAAEAFIADLEVIEGMELVPAGTFLFGPDCKEVFLDTFYIDSTPVTNAEFAKFMRETGYRAGRYMDDPQRNQPDQPVVGISFVDAQQYAKWAGKEIPTEQQWEKAARGTDGRPYPWGNDPPGSSDACYGLDCIEGAPMPVGKSLRNVSQFGVREMCGNIWHWTSTRFKKASEFMVVKGGSYNDPIEFLRLDFRLEAHPKDKCEAIGFRCVKNVHH